MPMPSPVVSLVSPAYDEEETLEIFYREVSAVLGASGRAYEIIFVNDGSRDGTGGILDSIAASDPRVVVISFTRNYGQHAAVYAGIQNSRGDCVIIMDSDLQHSPGEIPLFLAKMAEGWDMVSGRRVGRRESFFIRRLPSYLANYLLRKATGCPVRDSGGFKSLKGDLARSLIINKGQHRFLPALVHLQGGRIAEVEISAPPRRFGKSHYGLGRSLDVLFDIMLFWFQSAYVVHPLHLLGRVSAALLLAGSGILGWLLYEKVFLGVPMGTRPPLILSVMIMLMGVLSLLMGFVAEMISSLHQTLDERKPYRVARIQRADEKGDPSPQASWSGTR